ncbi:MAG: hypothetical protein RL235_361 [Chlamydiota bacterium]|jgi:Mn-dependent DtxR family transcriptional regulator
MSQKGKTPDEKLLHALYKTATERGDPYLPVDIALVAKATHQKETATKNIVKHLAQANLIQKVGDHQMQLTPRGERFVADDV